MPSNLTLNDGSANTAFTYRDSDKGIILWDAPSPQGDFDGAPTLRQAVSKTRGLVLVRSGTLLVPIYNSVLGKYEGFHQGRLTLSSPTTAPMVGAQKALKQLLSAFDTGVNASFQGEFVNGIGGRLA